MGSIILVIGIKLSLFLGALPVWFVSVLKGKYYQATENPPGSEEGKKRIITWRGLIWASIYALSAAAGIFVIAVALEFLGAFIVWLTIITTVYVCLILLFPFGSAFYWDSVTSWLPGLYDLYEPFMFLEKIWS